MSASRPERTWVHSLWPIAKPAWLVAATIWAVVLHGHWPWLIVILFVGLGYLAGMATDLLKSLAIVAWPALLGALAIALAGQAGGTEYGSVLGLSLTSSQLNQFSNTFGQWLAIINAGLLIALTTDPEDLFHSLVEVGLSAHLACSVSGALDALPSLKRRIDAVRDAQLSRGVAADGWLLDRARAFVAILRPVLLSTLDDAIDREVTLVLRGLELRVRNTALHRHPIRTGDWIALVVGLVACASGLLWWVVPIL